MTSQPRTSPAGYVADSPYNPHRDGLPDWCRSILYDFKEENGKQWRDKLWTLWLNGQDDYATNARGHRIGGVLRMVRNHPLRDTFLYILQRTDRPATDPR